MISARALVGTDRHVCPKARPPNRGQTWRSIPSVPCPLAAACIRLPPSLRGYSFHPFKRAEYVRDTVFPVSPPRGLRSPCCSSRRRRRRARSSSPATRTITTARSSSATSATSGWSTTTAPTRAGSPSTRARDDPPAFSPDGKWIAFSSDRYGNNDVFVMPSEGGPAKRLTYHSASDTVVGWSRDSQARRLLVGTRPGLSAASRASTRCRSTAAWSSRCRPTGASGARTRPTASNSPSTATRWSGRASTTAAATPPTSGSCDVDSKQFTQAARRRPARRPEAQQLLADVRQRRRSTSSPTATCRPRPAARRCCNRSTTSGRSPPTAASSRCR